MTPPNEEKSWPSRETIVEEHERFNRGEGTRDWSKFDLSACAHVASNVFTTDTGWIVQACVDCGHSESLGCSHPRCEWNDEGTLLRCTTCGIDGT